MRALVTGAARGIGRATALRLARDGYQVLVHYRSHAEEARAVVDEIVAGGGIAESVAVDLAQPTEVAAWVDRLRRVNGPLDVLVHNAGEYPRTAVDSVTPEMVRSLFETHVFAPLELTRRLRPRLTLGDPGRVVFVSSVLAFQGSAHGAHYAAAKAAQVGLVRSLAKELAPDIRVNAVAPGTIDTAILANDTDARRAERIRTIPLGRIGRPEDVANAIAFLASPLSGYMTGTTLPVNGGLRMG
jgi:3-oxoacyl-[acyl-carrier protein] reductase